MGNDWSRACTESLLNAGATRPLAIGSRSVLLALWAVTMLVGSITCYLWWRAGEKKKQVWPLYGRFVLLVALSGLAGIVNSASYMRSKDLSLAAEESQYRNPVSFQEYSVSQTDLLSESNHWLSVAYVAYGFEVLFLTSAKVQIMDRLIFFAYLVSSPTLTEEFRRRVYKIRNLFFLFIVLCCLCGVGLLITSSVYSQKASEEYFLAKRSYLQGDISSGNNTRFDAQVTAEKGFNVYAVQNGLEACVLGLIVLVFFVVGGRCIARIRRQMNRDNHSAQSEELQRKMYGIVGVVFIAFLVRFAFIAFLAYLNIGLSLSPFIRGANRCDERQSQVRRLYWWNTFTPQFETAIMIVSGPVTLLVALWGMTSARAREALLPTFLAEMLSSELESR